MILTLTSSADENSLEVASSTIKKGNSSISFCSDSRTRKYSYQNAMQLNWFRRRKSLFTQSNSLKPVVRPSVHSSVRPSVRSPVHPYVRSSVHPSVRSSVHPSVRSSVHPSVRSSVHPSVRSSVRPSARIIFGSEGLFIPPQELERSTP